MTVTLLAASIIVGQFRFRSIHSIQQNTLKVYVLQLFQLKNSLSINYQRPYSILNESYIRITLNFDDYSRLGVCCVICNLPFILLILFNSKLRQRKELFFICLLCIADLIHGICLGSSGVDRLIKVLQNKGLPNQK